MATYKLVDEEKLDAAMTATADAIRAKTGSTDPIAWDAEKGMSEAVEPVFEAGKKTLFEVFENINFFFFSNYNMSLLQYFLISDLSKIKTAQYVFQENTQIRDFLWPDSLAPKLIHGFFIRATNLTNVSGLSKIKVIVISDLFLGCTALQNAGELNVDTVSYASRTFDDCTSLKEIRMIGTLRISVNMQWSPLSKDSIISIINALSTATSDLPITLSITAVNNAFETSPGAADGSTSEEWTALIATKPNWTISLA